MYIIYYFFYSIYINTLLIRFHNYLHSEGLEVIAKMRNDMLKGKKDKIYY